MNFAVIRNPAKNSSAPDAPNDRRDATMAWGCGRLARMKRHPYRGRDAYAPTEPSGPRPENAKRPPEFRTSLSTRRMEAAKNRMTDAASTRIPYDFLDVPPSDERCAGFEEGAGHSPRSVSRFPAAETSDSQSAWRFPKGGPCRSRVRRGSGATRLRRRGAGFRRLSRRADARLSRFDRRSARGYACPGWWICAHIRVAPGIPHERRDAANLRGARLRGGVFVFTRLLRRGGSGLLTFVAGLFGLVIGSFLNVVIHRVPLGESVAWPGSKCPKCGASISPFDNVPVLSYLVLRGKCRNCGVRIPVRYPLVEAATGALLALAAYRFGLSFELAVAVVLVVALVSLAMTDLEHRLLPNAIVGPAAACGLVLSVVARPEWWWVYPASALAAAGGFSRSRSFIRAGWGWGM